MKEESLLITSMNYMCSELEKGKGLTPFVRVYFLNFTI